MSGTVDACLIDRTTGLPIGVTGNALAIGGIYNAAPALLTEGQRSSLQLTARGALTVQLMDSTNTVSPVVTASFADGMNPNDIGIQTNGRNATYNGTSWDRQRGDLNGTVVQSGLSATFWNYAAATGGIVNSTAAVTIKAAAGAGLRNYLKTLIIDHDALGAATEIAIRDGAAGTVLWRGKLITAMTEGSVKTFDPPLKGTANTLMEVVTLTATVTGGVFVNATGFTGS